MNWTPWKKELWQMPVEELNKKLEELQKEKFKAEIQARGAGRKRMNNTAASHVDIKGIRHRIACIKTILNTKQNEKGV